jgi:hypothetical protein
MSLTPVPSDSATCSNCSAPLVADQRYCLSCGQPCSPVRLAFLDVLQTEHQPQAGAGGYATAPVNYAQMPPPPATPNDWLRRYAPLFAVLSVLLMAMIVGLLVGHWVTQSKSPSAQIVKVEGLSAAAPTATTSTAPTSTTPTTSTSASAESKAAPSEADEVKKEAKVEKQQAAKVEHAVVVKPSSTKLKKLGTSTGKKHEEEINALGAQPIETGG